MKHTYAVFNRVVMRSPGKTFNVQVQVFCFVIRQISVLSICFFHDNGDLSKTRSFNVCNLFWDFYPHRKLQKYNKSCKNCFHPGNLSMSTRILTIYRQNVRVRFWHNFDKFSFLCFVSLQARKLKTQGRLTVECFGQA